MESDVYNVGAGRTADDSNQLSVQMLRGELMDWCSEQRRVSEQPLSEFGDLTLNMLHTKAKGTMTAKAEETRHLMPFISVLLERYEFSIGKRRATLLRGAGEA